MANTFSLSVELPSGQRIGYSLFKDVSGNWFVSFLDRDNRRKKKSLGVKTKTDTTELARQIIAQSFGSLLPSQVVTWDEAEELVRKKLLAKGLRETTVAAYIKDLNLVRKFYGATTGPADIDEPMAESWLEAYTTGKDARIRNKDKEAKKHSAHNVKTRLGSISALWEKWFVEELKIAKSNPFAKLEPPKADKKPIRFVNDEQMKHFFGFLGEYYLGWDFPTLFFSVKAYTGCRLADLSGIKSAQLRDGSIVFPADEAKGRKERAVPLPQAMFASLKARAGKTYLWEKYPAELLEVLKRKKGVPTHRLSTEFKPSRLYWWITNLFTEYKKAYPELPPISSHQFRKRAFTLAWEGGIDPKSASIAFGCNMDTLLKHYTHLDEGKVTASVFERIGNRLNGGEAQKEEKKS